ncbi:MAG: DUF1697 domain-containing protein [candidate division Zixibacteria bacterium]
MPKYAAFLRAINVGGHNIKMDHLRRLFEEMGYSNVETFIASGNVIFDSRSSSAKNITKIIERHLRDALGYEVATFIRTTKELAKIADRNPFGDDALKAKVSSLYIAFLKDKLDDPLAKKVISFASDVDEFHIDGREVYWLCRIRMLESEFSGAFLEKTLGMPATMRNSTTIRKMAAKYT